MLLEVPVLCVCGQRTLKAGPGLTGSPGQPQEQAQVGTKPRKATAGGGCHARGILARAELLGAVHWGAGQWGAEKQQEWVWGAGQALSPSSLGWNVPAPLRPEELRERLGECPVCQHGLAAGEPGPRPQPPRKGEGPRHGLSVLHSHLQEEGRFMDTQKLFLPA